MICFYFSGTGNSKYIAEAFSNKMNISRCAIDSNNDFTKLMQENESIAFCYPIYGSRVPRIMREFVLKYKTYLKDKKIIIFCTQLLFSGDGARAFTDILPKNYFRVIYAEHFKMPNNICNVRFFPPTKSEKIEKYLKNADQKLDIVCSNIKNKIIKKRGFNIFSMGLGLIQGVFMPSMERAGLNSVRISDSCSRCMLCVRLCPMHNLALKDNHIAQKGNCTLCYRCVNSCPQRAITVLIHNKVKTQYKGI